MKRNEGNTKAKNKPLSSIKRPPRQHLIIWELEVSEDQKEERGEQQGRAFAKPDDPTLGRPRAGPCAGWRCGARTTRRPAGTARWTENLRTTGLGGLGRGRSIFICPSQVK